MKMKLASFLLISALFSNVQAATIADLPASQNALVNDFVDIIVTNKDITPQALNEAVDAYVTNSTSRPAVFASLVSLFDQVSEQTLLGAKSHLQFGYTDRYHRSMEGTEAGMYISYLSDVRLQNLNRGYLRTDTVFGRVFLKLDLLSDAEFKVFADAFIQSLKIARANLPRINDVLKLVARQEGRGPNYEVFERTYADLLLIQAFELEVPGTSSVLSSRLQELVSRTLVETDGLSDLRTRVLEHFARSGSTGRSCGALFAPVR